MSKVNEELFRDDISSVCKGCTHLNQLRKNISCAVLSNDYWQQAEEEDVIMSDHFDDDDTFGFMGNKPLLTLTQTEKESVSKIIIVANLI
jgi:hypothetical protein